MLSICFARLCLCRWASDLKSEGRSYRFCRLVDDIVYDSVFLSLLRVHDEVALHIFFYFVEFLPAVLRQQLIRDLAHTKNLTRMNINISSLSRQTAHGRLMY